MKHTPGPWHIGMKPGPMIYGPNGEGVADMCILMVPNDEHKANIRLIAAAPELLELAQAFLSYLEDDSQSPRRKQACLEGARAAIAKATGE